jgi:hypothetical protein
VQTTADSIEGKVDTVDGVVDGLVTAVAALPTEERTISLMFDRVNVIEDGLITAYTAGGDVEVAVPYDDDGVPERETVQ